jgi:hypothetical protein
MKTVAQLLKHDFDKGSLHLYDFNGNLIYIEYSTGYWVKYEYDSNGNRIYFENSDGYWVKREYDDNGKVIYCEDSTGIIIDKRPKTSCEGKVVEIDGKTYKLVELNQNKDE